MSTTPTPEQAVVPPTGHAARKKLATLQRIQATALDLFERQGYEATTLAQIAEAAGVAPRTIFAYFAGKEAIVLSDEPVFYERLEQALLHRPPGSTTVDALRAFFTSSDPSDAQARRRGRIIAASRSLHGLDRTRSERLEHILATSIARDIGAPPDDLRPVMVAGSMASAFSAARNRRLAGRDRPLSHAETMQLLEDALAFLDGGLAALAERRQP